MKRVLHVGSMGACGGMGQFFMNLFREIDKNEIQFDYIYFNRDSKGYYHDEIISLGGKVHYVNCEDNEAAISKQWEDFFNKNKYDAVHYHAGWRRPWNVYNSYYCFDSAKKHNMKTIMHAHVTIVDKPDELRKKMEPQIRAKADHLFACSEVCGKSLFENDDFTIINNGIDVKRFKYNDAMRDKIRKNLKLDGFTVMTVARLSEEKNQLFLLEVFKELLDKQQDANMVFAGDGPMRPEIEAKIKQLGLDKKVKMLGVRNDIGDLLNAADAFILPSLYEGLPICLVEAQTNGLPCLASTGVSQEANLTGLISYLDLDDGVQKWSETLAQMKSGKREEYAQKIIDAGYSVCCASKVLTKVYQDKLKSTKSPAGIKKMESLKQSVLCPNGN